MRLLIVFLIVIIATSISAILVDVNHYELIGPMCNNDVKYWDSRLTSKNTTFNIYMKSCSTDNHEYTLVATSSMYTGIIRCNSTKETCGYIHNPNDFIIDVRYIMDDVTPAPNVYIILFYIGLAASIGIIVLSIVLCLVIGIVIGKCSKADIYLATTDEQLKETFIEKAKEQQDMLF